MLRIREYQIEPDLRERRLSDSPLGDFRNSVEKTWLDPNFAHPGGESNSSAQKRGLAVISKLNKQFGEEHIAISTHGNFLAATLEWFEPSIDFSFWQSMTLPDIYKSLFTPGGQASIVHIWHSPG